VPGGYPADNTTAPNDSVARVNGNTHSMGPAILLKVMSGDSVALAVRTFYRSGGSAGGTQSSLPDILSSLASGLVGMTGGSHGVIADLNNTSGSPVYAALNSFLPTNEPATTSTPKAYLNWMLLDDQFNYVSDNNQSGAMPVGSPDVLNTIGGSIGLKKSGYLYIWVSNETKGWDVFFDNLSVKTYSGPMLEEDHYYPFGLTMTGISDKALKGNYVENKYRFNSKELQHNEFSDGSGLELYDYGARMYDPQIGRWQKTDGKAELYFNITPYAYAANQPTNAIDPDGNVVIFINGMAPASQQGNSSYWRYSETIRTTYNNVTHRTGSPHNRIVEHAFDKDVMNQLGDKKARYYDGSVGGVESWFSEPDMIFSQKPQNLSAAYRDDAGYATGKAEAAAIIEGLTRTGGVITESIKIITHSMGGAFGKGFVRALKEYIKTLPPAMQKQIKITLVADFDPFNAGEITADPDIKTMQFKHANFWNIRGMGWLANEDEQGLDKKDIHTNTDASTDHGIFTFFGDINSLTEGVYKWDGTKWVKQ
jgi:RHS repeat-associated protein